MPGTFSSCPVRIGFTFWMWFAFARALTVGAAEAPVGPGSRRRRRSVRPRRHRREAPKLLPLLEDADPRVALAALDAALTLAIEAPGVLLPAVAALLPRLTGEARYSALTGVRGVLMEEPALAAKLSLVPAVLQRCCESKDSDDQNAGFAALGVLRPAGLARVEALLAKLERSADPMIKESARAIRTPEE